MYRTVSRPTTFYYIYLSLITRDTSIMGTHHQKEHHNKVPLSSVQVGVMFDHHMDMTTQVTKMCQAAWFQLRNIRSVRSSLTKEATLRLVCSLVMSCLD